MAHGTSPFDSYTKVCNCKAFEDYKKASSGTRCMSNSAVRHCWYASACVFTYLKRREALLCAGVSRASLSGMLMLHDRSSRRGKWSDFSLSCSISRERLQYCASCSTCMSVTDDKCCAEQGSSPPHFAPKGWCRYVVLCCPQVSSHRLSVAQLTNIAPIAHVQKCCQGEPCRNCFFVGHQHSGVLPPLGHQQIPEGQQV